MTKNIDTQKVNEELKSLGKAPAFTGSDFDRAVMGEILKNEMAVELRILQAFEMGRRSTIREERTENEEKSTVVETIQVLAINFDDELNAIECDTIAIDDIDTLIGQLRVDMDNVDRKDILGYFRDFHLRVRVLNELTRSASQSLNKNLMAANEVQKELYDNAYKPGSPVSSVDIGPNKENNSDYPVKEAQWMLPERDREVAMKYNTLAFIKEFDRAPVNEQEVLEWVSEIVEEVRENNE